MCGSKSDPQAKVVAFDAPRGKSTHTGRRAIEASGPIRNHASEPRLAVHDHLAEGCGHEAEFGWGYEGLSGVQGWSCVGGTRA